MLAGPSFTATASNDVATHDALRATLRGELVVPDDRAYDSARSLWNGLFDKRPALIVRCAEVADVIAAVNYAREHQLRVAVRGGGHSAAGHSMSDGGMTIDLSAMKHVTVDPVARVARAEAGLLLGELDLATQAFGLAVPAGQISHTGIAGLTLGGGMGWLMRKYGLTIDSLLSVQIVTADGRLLMASEHEHADLFWGVRGGGGNFGIVTSFEYRLHAVGPVVLAGPVIYTLDQAPDVLRAVRLAVAHAPVDEAGVIGNAFATHTVVLSSLCVGAGDVSAGRRGKRCSRRPSPTRYFREEPRP